MSRFPGMRFVGRPIDRAASATIRKDAKLLDEVQRSPKARFLVAHTTVRRQGAAILFTTTDPLSLAWWTRDEVCAVSEEAERAAIYLGPVAEGGPALAAAGGPVEAFAVDLSACLAEADAEAKALERQQRWATGRELLTLEVTDADVTVAGIALSLLCWSRTARFDGRSGGATEPAEGGVKRQERGGKGRTYPRTDPVAIGLVVAPDGQTVLLQAPARPGFETMYTCVSGFVDQCESVEEAFRREVFEETGVTLASVELVGSQAWPIGRAGSCELMIGCRGVAASMELQPAAGEVHDARWFSREEVLQLMDGTHPKGWRMPGAWAIAHHLIKSWAVPATSSEAVKA